MITDLPAELRTLQQAWTFDYNKTILELEDRLLERFLRIGGDLMSFDKMKRGYQVVIWHSGGGGTMEGTPVDKPTYLQFQEIAKKEMMHNERQTKQQKEQSAKEQGLLENFLLERKVSLELKQKGIPAEVFRLTLEAYKLLPEHHLGHNHFKILKMGGWGNGAAKFSMYDDPIVHVFECAIKGVRRNFLGVLLHETGHSFTELLRESQPNMYVKAEQSYKIVSAGKQTSSSVPAADYLHGIKSRRERLLSSFEEFIPELYLLYICNGEALRNFVTGLNGEEGLAWKKLYLQIKTNFRGREYR